jgi:acyl-CoA thioesterase
MTYQYIYNRTEKSPSWKLLGMRIKKVSKGCAEIGLPYRKELCNFLGTIHGGFITSIADAAGGVALMTLTGEEKLLSTVELKLNFFKPVQQDIKACANALHKGGTLGVSYIEVKLDRDDSLVAAGTATYFIKSEGCGSFETNQISFK